MSKRFKRQGKRTCRYVISILYLTHWVDEGGACLRLFKTRRTTSSTRLPQSTWFISIKELSFFWKFFENLLKKFEKTKFFENFENWKKQKNQNIFKKFSKNFQKFFKNFSKNFQKNSKKFWKIIEKLRNFSVNPITSYRVRCGISSISSSRTRSSLWGFLTTLRQPKNLQLRETPIFKGFVI